MSLCDRHRAEFTYLQDPNTSPAVFSQTWFETPEDFANAAASVTTPAPITTSEMGKKVGSFKKWLVAIYGIATIFLILGMLMNFAVTARIGCCTSGTDGKIKEAEKLLLWYWALIATLLIVMMLILLFVYRSIGMVRLYPVFAILIFACAGLGLGVWAWTLVKNPLRAEYLNEGCKWSKGHPYRTARIVTGVTGLTMTLGLLVLVFSLTKMGCPGPWAYSHLTENIAQ